MKQGRLLRGCMKVELFDSLITFNVLTEVDDKLYDILYRKIDDFIQDNSEKKLVIIIKNAQLLTKIQVKWLEQNVDWIDDNNVNLVLIASGESVNHTLINSGLMRLFD